MCHKGGVMYQHELLMWDNKKDMCWELKLGSERVQMSYEMGRMLRQMIEDHMMERINEHIRTIADDCRGYW